ncbi:hypothetical protein [Pseudooceanicola sp.]|uniref:hypothetical protein n=1 Tax=Pseudooceanicola sp. TaxID=1914328 RepID=UPI0035C72E1D
MECLYCQLTTRPNAWAEVGQAVAALRDSGDLQAEITAAFAIQIGLSINTVPVLMRSPDRAVLEAGAVALASLPGVTGVTSWPMRAVSERALAALRPEGGVYTNRWFHVRESGVAEFEADTLTAWDDFEARTGAEVVGLWSCAPKDGVVIYLLIARYDSLDAWDKSRFFNRGEDQRDADWMEKFRRRREMMVDSSVITTRCLFGPS